MISKTRPIEQYDLIDTEKSRRLVRKYAYQIGKYIFYFSELEHDINRAVASVISERTDEPGYQVVKYLKNVANKAQYLHEVYGGVASVIREEKGVDFTSEVESFFKDLHKEFEFRNKLAHVNWSSLTDSGYVRTKIERNNEGRVVFKSVKIKPETIKQHIIIIDELMDELLYLQEKLEVLWV